MEESLVCALCGFQADSELGLDSHIGDNHSYIWKKEETESFCDTFSNLDGSFSKIL
jgi:hypothetical protein